MSSTEEAEEVFDDTDYRAEAEQLLGEADTAFGPQIDAQAWSAAEPSTTPQAYIERHTWGTVARNAAALIGGGIVVAIAVAGVGSATQRWTLYKSMIASTTPAATSTPPPPPRVDTVADFKAAFECSNGAGACWVIGGADYYGGPPHGATALKPGDLTSWQPQMLLLDVDTVTERLKPLGVTVVTAPPKEPADVSRRVRFFTAQTLEQDITLQKYLQGKNDNGEFVNPKTSSWEWPLRMAMMGNTGFCMPDSGPCEER
ncbi:MAG: hypothetical protein ACLQLO_27720 [Mycobacterium sp.]